MVFLAGVILWIAVGIATALIARRILRSPHASVLLTILWAVLGALMGGLVGVIPYLPEDAEPWRVVPIACAFAGGSLLALLHRVVRRRWGRAARPPVHAAVVLLLAVTTTGLAWTIWYMLAVATPRLYRPTVNPALPETVSVESLEPDALRAQMVELARIHLSREENAGIAIGLTIDGARVVVAEGVASKDHQSARIDEQSLFEIGSVTKTITGVALASAIVAGQLDGEERIVAVLGDDVPAGLEGLRIDAVDLATHASGLPEYPSSMPWWTALITDNPYERLTEEGLLLSLRESAASSRGSYRYSNYGFIVLGHVLEKAGGQGYGRLLQERIFDPLGMNRTGVVVGDDVEGLVDGHSLGRIMPHWTGHRFAGAAGVVSTVDDMLTFLEAHLYPERTPLSEAVVLATADHGAAWGNRRIGFGWHIVPADTAPRVVYHAGNTLGFYSWVGFAPDVRVGVVVLANSNDPSPAAIGARLLHAAVGQ